MKRTVIYTLAAILLLMPVAGCKSKKNLTKDNRTEQTGKTDKQHEKKEKTTPTEQLEWERLCKRNLEVRTFEARKAALTVTLGTQQFSGKADLRFIADSVLSISLQPFLGVELFRLDITRSNLLLVDKLNRQYIEMTYPELQKQTGLNISFTDIQAIVQARMFIVGQDALSLPYNKRTYLPSSDKLHKTVSFSADKLNYEYTYEPETACPTVVKITMSDAKRAGEGSEIEYVDYALMESFYLPMLVEANYTSAKLNAGITVSCSNLVFNQAVQITPPNISRFTKTSLWQLIH